MRLQVAICGGTAERLEGCLTALLAREPDLDLSDVVVASDKPIATTFPIRKVIGPPCPTGLINTGIAALDPDRGYLTMDDDVRLQTYRGFTRLAERVEAAPAVGWAQPAMTGDRVLPEQRPMSQSEDFRNLPAVGAHCTYVPLRTHRQLGGRDERYTGYGVSDIDYYVQVRQAGGRVVVWDGCLIEHGHPVWFGQRRGRMAQEHAKNNDRFQAKWGIPPQEHAIQRLLSEERSL